jgi:cyclase
MDSDGQKNGYDLGVTSRAAQAVNIPIIASGGAGTAQHIVDAFAAGADAALLASLLHFRELSIAEIKAAMQQAKLPVRI